MVIQEKLYSADDLWRLAHLPGNDGKRLDLIDGVLIDMTPAGEEHGDIASELNMQIRAYVKTHDLGRVTAAETGYVLYTSSQGKDTVLGPNVGFISKARAAAQPSKKYVPLPPDLAVEVVSPNDDATLVHDKVLKYLRYGTRLVWVVYPESRTVAVYTPSGAHTLHADDTLDGGDVLPGFRLPIASIFPSTE